MNTISIPAREMSTMRRRARRLLVAPLAALAVALVWLLAERSAGLDLHEPAFGSAAPRPLGLAFAAAVAAVAALLGWGLLALFECLSNHGARRWLQAALIALLLSLAGPLSGHGIDAGNRAALIAMHVVAAAVVIPWLYRSSHGKKTTTSEQGEQ